MNTTYKISLDVHKIESQVSITAFRGDSGYTIIANLTEDGRPVHVSDKSAAIFKGVKADGNILLNACIIKNGRIIYDFKSTTPDGETCQTTACPGVVKCQFVITENDNFIATPQFNIVVTDTVFDESKIVDSVSQATALTELAASIIEMKNNGEFKGEQGEQGIQGIQGVRGEKGEPGSSISRIAYSRGYFYIDLTDGTKKICDGFVYVERVSVSPDGDLYVYTSDGMRNTIGNVRGADGYTPIKGVDYYTDADVSEIVDEVLSRADVDALKEASDQTRADVDNLIAASEELKPVAYVSVESFFSTSASLRILNAVDASGMIPEGVGTNEVPAYVFDESTKTIYKCTAKEAQEFYAAHIGTTEGAVDFEKVCYLENVVTKEYVDDLFGSIVDGNEVAY